MFARNDFSKYEGQRLYGRIRSYSHQKGYGFVATELQKDIFISSYQIKHLEKKIMIGATITFVPELYNGSYVATNIELVDNITRYDPRRFYLPSGHYVLLKRIEKIIRMPGKDVLTQKNIPMELIEANDHTVDDFNAVCIALSNGEEFFVFEETCPVNTPEKVPSLKQYYQTICEKYFYL